MKQKKPPRGWQIFGMFSSSAEEHDFLLEPQSLFASSLIASLELMARVKSILCIRRMYRENTCLRKEIAGTYRIG